jgi:predicted O-methyltransferase YrrM
MIKSFYNRFQNKIRRELKHRSYKRIPFQPDVTFQENGTHWYEPIIAGPSTFSEDCSSASTLSAVSEILKKLTPDKYVKFNLEYFREGLKRFGSKWRYADINTVLYGISKNIQIENYLEIGVRRGRSMSMVASLHPKAQLFGFDMWIPNYVGIENPGPDFVKKELVKVNYKGKVEFISGNSHKTVPQFIKENSEMYFDLITVDGDHTAKGATQDLQTVIPRLKIGGFLIFDDICNAEHLYLKKVWDKAVTKNPRFQSYSFEELGHGVAFAIRQY